MDKIKRMLGLIHNQAEARYWSYYAYVYEDYVCAMHEQLLALYYDSEADELFDSMSTEELAEYYDMGAVCLSEGETK
jgi:hypothetical protein